MNIAIPFSSAEEQALILAVKRLTTDLDIVILRDDLKLTSVLRSRERNQNRPYITLQVIGSLIWIGPLRVTGTTGCALCLKTRRDALHPYPKLLAQVDTQQSIPLTQQCLEQIAFCIARLQQLDQVKQRAIYLVDALNGSVKLHYLLPVSDCLHCDQRPIDHPGPPLNLPIVPKRSRFTFRTPSEDLASTLSDTYVNDQLGIVKSLWLQPVGIFHDVGAHVALPGFSRLELTSGRGISPISTRIAAIAEALERYGGVRPFRKRTAWWGKYTQYQDIAIDPASLGLHDDPPGEQSGLVTYQPSLAFNWVWGTSLQSGEYKLIPEQAVYYGLESNDHSPQYVRESSNGCAVGSNLTETVLYGLLELIERDAFLMAWYTRKVYARVNLTSGTSRNIEFRLERLKRVTGYEVMAFDITTEIGIPAVWCVAFDSAKRPGRPYTFHAAAAHLSAERALEAALHELAPSIAYGIKKYPEERSRLLTLLDQPYQLTRMEDHSALYWLPETANRLAFLGEVTRLTTLRAMQERCLPARTIYDDLQLILGRLRDQGMDAFVIDQTALEHTAGGLMCAKVIVPGLLPMTFGHQNRRTKGFHRLKQAQIEGTDINPHPHPFP